MSERDDCKEVSKMLGAGVPPVVPPSEPAEAGPLLFVAIVSLAVFVGTVLAGWVRSVKAENRTDESGVEEQIDRAA